jgi:hypothetical protein
MAESRGRKPRQQNNGPTFLALIALIGAAVGLIALTTLVLPQVAGFALVISGFVILGTLQYLIWGRWISRVPQEDDPDAEQ